MMPGAPTALAVGDRVRDVYTGHEGTFLARDDSRVTAQMPTYRITGCWSWFDLVTDRLECVRCKTVTAHALGATLARCLTCGRDMPITR